MNYKTRTPVRQEILVQLVLVVLMLVVLSAVAIAVGDYTGVVEATPLIEQFSATLSPRIRNF